MIHPHRIARATPAMSLPYRGAALFILSVHASTVALWSTLSVPSLVYATVLLIVVCALGLKGVWSGPRPRADDRMLPLAFAPSLPIAIVALTVLSIRGPTGMWFHFWADPAARSITIVLLSMSAAWMGYGLLIAGRRTHGVSRSTVVAGWLAGIGLAVLVGTFLLPDFEGLLRALDTRFAILPVQPSILAGITEYAAVDGSVLRIPVYVGATMLALGLATAWWARRGRPHRRLTSSSQNLHGPGSGD
jgi:hypothetical protein